MTKAERDALRELERAATPGPWGNNCGDIENKIAHPNVEDAPLDFYPGNVAVVLRGYDDATRTDCGFQRAPDEDLAVAARNALPALLDAADEADRLRAVLEAAKALVKAGDDYCHSEIPVSGCWPTLVCALKKCRAAIAAAEGRR